MENPQSASLRSGTEVYVNQVPFFHYNDELKSYPLELRINTSRDVDYVSVRYYNFGLRSFFESRLDDDGNNYDKIANDNIFTSDTTIVDSRNIRNLFSDSIFYHTLLSSTETTVFYKDGSTEDFRIQLDGYTIDGDRINIDTANFEISEAGSFYYSKHVANYVMPKEYSRNQINFPVREIREEFEGIWTDFKDAYLAFAALTESNIANNTFQTSADPFNKYFVNLRGMATALPVNHEINHFWVYPSRFDFFANHLQYVERPQSGFGYGCTNGVMTNIRREDGRIRYSVDKTNPHDYYYNDIELNLMGVLPVDSVDFPIKYVKSTGSRSCEPIFQTIQGGPIEYLTKEEYIDFVSNINVPNISDGLDLKFIFMTEEKISKEEHAFLEFLVLNYEKIFRESTSNLAELNTEFYDIITTSTEASLGNDYSITVFPNPSEGLLNIELTSDIAVEATLVSTTGQALINTQINQRVSQLDIGELPAGIYFIEFLDDTGQSQIKKIVKH